MPWGEQRYYGPNIEPEPGPETVGEIVRTPSGCLIATTFITAVYMAGAKVAPPVIETTRRGASAISDVWEQAGEMSETYDEGGAHQNAPTYSGSEAVVRPFGGDCTDDGLYQVQVGDTLFRIAQKEGTTVADLASQNGLTNPDHVEAGRCLEVGNNR